jgi:hypothetical protein
MRLRTILRYVKTLKWKPGCANSLPKKPAFNGGGFRYPFPILCRSYVIIVSSLAQLPKIVPSVTPIGHLRKAPKASLPRDHLPECHDAIDVCKRSAGDIWGDDTLAARDRALDRGWPDHSYLRRGQNLACLKSLPSYSMVTGRWTAPRRRAGLRYNVELFDALSCKIHKPSQKQRRPGLGLNSAHIVLKRSRQRHARPVVDAATT